MRGRPIWGPTGCAGEDFLHPAAAPVSKVIVSEFWFQLQTVPESATPPATNQLVTTPGTSPDVSLVRMIRELRRGR